METPNQISERLRLIASKLEISKHPNQDLVVNDLKLVLLSLLSRTASSRRIGPNIPAKISVDVSVDDQFDHIIKSLDGFNNQNYDSTTIKKIAVDDICKRIASVMIRIAQEAEELGLWDLDEGERTVLKWDDARKETNNEENLESKLKLLKRQIDKFINSFKGSEKEMPESEVITSAP
jgi:hypothetical protein